MFAVPSNMRFIIGVISPRTSGGVRRRWRCQSFRRSTTPGARLPAGELSVRAARSSARVRKNTSSAVSRTARSISIPPRRSRARRINGQPSVKEATCSSRTRPKRCAVSRSFSKRASSFGSCASAERAWTSACKRSFSAKPSLAPAAGSGPVTRDEVCSPRVGWNQSRHATAWPVGTGETSESPQRRR